MLCWVGTGRKAGTKRLQGIIHSTEKICPHRAKGSCILLITDSPSSSLEKRIKAHFEFSNSVSDFTLVFPKASLSATSGHLLVSSVSNLPQTYNNISLHSTSR